MFKEFLSRIASVCSLNVKNDSIGGLVKVKIANAMSTM